MFTTLISGLCAYVVNHPPTTNLDEPMVVVGVIVGAKGNACRPVIAMFDDSATIPKRGSPLGPHKFEVKIGNDSATLKVDGASLSCRGGWRDARTPLACMSPTMG
jgi:hypothetical protein